MKTLRMPCRSDRTVSHYGALRCRQRIHQPVGCAASCSSHDQVGSDQIMNPWLDEGLAEFSMYDYFAGRYGEPSAEQLRELRWQLPLADLRRRDRDAPIGLPVRDYKENYETLVYGKGAEFFATLRDELGPAIFDRLLRTYLDRYRWRIATPAEFRALAEEISGEGSGGLVWGVGEGKGIVKSRVSSRRLCCAAWPAHYRCRSARPARPPKCRRTTPARWHGSPPRPTPAPASRGDRAGGRPSAPPAAARRPARGRDRPRAIWPYCNPVMSGACRRVSAPAVISRKSPWPSSKSTIVLARPAAAG